MTFGGLCVMVMSTVGVVAMLLYCLVKVLTLGPTDESKT